MKYIVTINGKNYEVEVEKGAASIVRTTEAVGTKYNEEVVATAHDNKEVQKQQKVQVNSAFEPIEAPMPGIILDVKVAKGSTVKRGQVLFILEAMKMKNMIRSPREGTVASVEVTSGQKVGFGAVIIRFA